MIELTEELVVHVAAEQHGWHEQLLSQSVRNGLADSLEIALNAPAHQGGVVARALAAGSPAGSALVACVAAAESARISALGEWLARHLEALGRRPATGISPDDLAVLLACVVEGRILFHHIGRSGLPHPWGPDDASEVGWLAAHLVDQLTMSGADPGPRRAQGVEAWGRDLVDRTERARVMLATLGEAMGASLSDPGLPGSVVVPARLVDLGRLARTLGLTERRLYGLWPTVADLNADVVADVSRRHLQRAQERAMASISAGMAQDRSWNELYISVVQDIIVEGAQGAAGPVFASSAAIADPVVSQRMRTENDDYRVAHTVAVLALFQGIGQRLLVDTDRYLDAVFTSLLGAERLARLHPDLIRRTVSVGGGPHPLLGTGLGVLFRSLTSLSEDDLVEGTGLEAMSPVIAFLGQGRTTSDVVAPDR